MKKLPQALLCLLLCSSLYAYNPSAGGEMFYLLGTPGLLSDGISVVGGALTDVTVANGAVNPSVTAEEERTTHLTLILQISLVWYIGYEIKQLEENV